MSDPPTSDATHLNRANPSSPSTARHQRFWPEFLILGQKRIAGQVRIREDSRRPVRPLDRDRAFILDAIVAVDGDSGTARRLHRSRRADTNIVARPRGRQRSGYGSADDLLARSRRCDDDRECAKSSGRKKRSHREIPLSSGWH